MKFIVLSLTLLASSCMRSATLFDAIATVESTNGKKSGNIYQIQPEYVADVNRIQRKVARVNGGPVEHFTCESVFNKTASERMMEIYWAYYCERLGRWDDETKAKLHRVGFRGMKTRRTLANEYWAKVRSNLSKQQEGR